MKAQERVAKAVEERGYYEGFTKDELAARHVAKLTEELRELSACVRQFSAGVPNNWELDLDEAGYYAKREFDDADVWELSEIL